MTVSTRKQKRRFNLFDALILLAVVAVIAAIAYIMSGKAAPKIEQTIKATYQVEITGVDNALKNTAQVGDTVRDGVKRVNIGVITAVEAKPYTVQIPNESKGTIVTAPLSDLCTVVLTIDADARSSGRSYEVNGSLLSVGEKMYIQSKNFAGEGYCIGLTLKNNQ